MPIFAFPVIYFSVYQCYNSCCFIYLYKLAVLYIVFHYFHDRLTWYFWYCQQQQKNTHTKHFSLLDSNDIHLRNKYYVRIYSKSWPLPSAPNENTHNYSSTQYDHDRNDNCQKRKTVNFFLDFFTLLALLNTRKYFLEVTLNFITTMVDITTT